MVFFVLRQIGSVYNKINRKGEAIDIMEEALAIYKKLNLEWEIKDIQDTINRLKT
ncbi:MAG: tetratricopeptide repeat protein [Promethearchaeota archaeon]